MELRAALETPKTLRLKVYKFGRSGFTLIEILIVLGLVAFLSTIAIPRFESTNSKLRREVRNITVLMKRLHHLARLNRQTYRLVIDFPENDEHKYWVESSSKKVFFNKEKEDDEKRMSKGEKEKKQIASGFTLDTSLTKKPHAMPTHIFFESVELASRNEVITSGRAYIHFLPQGLAEESAVMLTDKAELHWTIVLNPLTGQGDIVDGKTTLKEARGE
jgi:prepilin-type N-terminal cleavage/methylation domain-containing protein